MALVVGAVIVIACMFWWFAQRADERAERDRVAPIHTTSPAASVLPVHNTQSLDRLIDEVNAAIQRFDNTDDFAIKRVELPSIERLSKKILALLPTHKQALQLQEILPGIRLRLEEESVEDRDNPVDEGRAGLQKVAYGMVGKEVGANDKARFKQDMTEFASADPLVAEIAAKARKIVEETPGVLQSGIYPYFLGYSKEQVRYGLYFADELGWIRRVKKGRSYQLFPPSRDVSDGGVDETRTRRGTQMNMDLFRAFVLQELGVPLDDTKPEWLSGDNVTAALWELNARFRPNYYQIASLSYQAEFEVEADAAIEAMAFKQPGADWSGVSANAMRVLLERQQQGIQLAMLNEKAGNPLMAVTAGLPSSAHIGAVMLVLLHGMKLPFPVRDRAGFEIPVGTSPASRQRH